jgi:hypothetical protein
MTRLKREHNFGNSTKRGVSIACRILRHTCKAPETTGSSKKKQLTGFFKPTDATMISEQDIIKTPIARKVTNVNSYAILMRMVIALIQHVQTMIRSTNG